MKNKYVTYKDIMSDDPCYDPKKIGMPVNYRASIPEFIQEYRHKVNCINNIFWVLLRKKYLTKKQFIWFALKCVRRIEHLIKDQRSVDALDVAERYLKGEATREELKISQEEAYAAYIGYKYLNEADIYLAVYYIILASYTNNVFNAITISRDTVNSYICSSQPINIVEEINAQIDILLEVLN